MFVANVKQNRRFKHSIEQAYQISVIRFRTHGTNNSTTAFTAR